MACELAREAAAARARARDHTGSGSGTSSAPQLDAEKTDNHHSWVMLKPSGEIEPLEGESILLKTPDYVSLELRVPQGMRTANPNFSLKCDDGVAYMTNKRVSRPHILCLLLLTAMTDHLPRRQAHGHIPVLLSFHTRHIRPATQGRRLARIRSLALEGRGKASTRRRHSR